MGQLQKLIKTPEVVLKETQNQERHQKEQKKITLTMFDKLKENTDK